MFAHADILHCGYPPSKNVGAISGLSTNWNFCTDISSLISCFIDHSVSPIHVCPRKTL